VAEAVREHLQEMVAARYFKVPAKNKPCLRAQLPSHIEVTLAQNPQQSLFLTLKFGWKPLLVAVGRRLFVRFPIAVTFHVSMTSDPDPHCSLDAAVSCLCCADIFAAVCASHGASLRSIFWSWNAKLRLIELPRTQMVLF